MQNQFLRSGVLLLYFEWFFDFQPKLPFMLEKQEISVLKQFPKAHLLAVMGLSVTVGAAFFFTSGSSVEAQRVTAHLDLENGQLVPATAPAPSKKKVQEVEPAGSEMPTPQETLVQVKALTNGNASGWENTEAEAVKAHYTGPDSETAVSENSPSEPAPLEWDTYTVQSGDTLSRIFSRAGLNNRAMYQVINGEGKGDQLSRLRQGQEIEFGFDGDGELQALVLHHSRTHKLEATRAEEGFTTREVLQEPDVELAFTGGEIQTSYALAANRAGLNHGLRSRLSNIFGWEIDFSRDLRRGDQFAVLYEEHYIDGEKVGYGRILAASFRNRGKEYSAVLFTDEDGRSDYYAPDGSSMRKAFLRAPLEYRRVSSHFDLNRQHPILNRTRPHEGTDFAASPGTPIRASGDGRISFIGRDGGYGRTIRIDHGNDVTTVYAHMRGYARGMTRGKRVSQGDIIGYVGMSGLATGPHLHYEYRVNGQPRNPMRVDLPDADPIPESQMQAFRQQAEPLLAQMSTREESFQIALTDTDN